jgi:cysteinyl-tRNA synthetase
MTLRLHNTLTKTIDVVTPIKAGTITIYSCGPTVYDHVHIGNLSAFITADILRRTIAAQNLSVKHVMNFTDVDDKTIRRSQEQYPDIDAMDALKKLTEKYGALFLEDMKSVGNDIEALTFIRAADIATIDGMRNLITKLYNEGFAYIADDGVYFSIEAYRASGKKYGQLVEITDESTSNQRIQNDEYDKESAHDFALWKLQKPGEPAWEFILDGHALTGRPGWHIECSVMSRIELGQPFDIHTGGIDLAFPHHENEIAQSTAGEKNPIYASIFVHNEHILVDGKKMAKSAQNFYTLNDLIEKGVDPLAFRLLVLQSHYRKPTNFNLVNAEAAHNRLRHWRNIAALRWQIGRDQNSEIDDAINQSIHSLNDAMINDLDTPTALQVIDDIFTKIETLPRSQLPQTSLINLISTIDALLGIQLVASTPNITDDVQKLIENREKARKHNNWAESDKLRDVLAQIGVEVKDTPDGTIWSYR